ncbi:MAG: 6-carboxytetrahydropterin synthase [Rhodospirillales bacterium]
MIRLTRRYRFSASHRLHSPRLSDEENRAIYGKCNNRHGHGHNYVLEVSVRGPVEPETGRAADVAALDSLVQREIISAFDHRNLNAEVFEFASAVPTTENLVAEIERRLRRGWSAVFPGRWPELDRIRIQETRRNTIEARL